MILTMSTLREDSKIVLDLVSDSSSLSATSSSSSKNKSAHHFNVTLRCKLVQTCPAVSQPSGSTSLFIHSTACLLLFTVVWIHTLGGYVSSLPLFLYLFIYAYGWRQLLSIHIAKIIVTNLLSNVKDWFQSERRALLLIMTYFGIKASLFFFYPQGEKSNGSPLSLILFSALFVFIFIAPTLLIFLGLMSARTIKFIFTKLCCIFEFMGKSSSSKKDKRMVNFIHGSQENCGTNKSKVFSTLGKWKLSIFVILFLTIIAYIADGDITSLIRFICIGKPCWPLLVEPGAQLQGDLPYYLKFAWVKSWHKIFDGYQPSWIIKESLLIAREMEVIHTLPLLIGLYILSKLLLPRDSVTIKKTLFGCIASVVLAGITSGSLKLFFHRFRPNAYGNPYYWTGPSTTHINHAHFSKLDMSFPCGHTSVTSAIATCLYLALMQSWRSGRLSRGLNVWSIICLYFYPCLVLVSRVSDCYHWASDGMFGIFLGYVIGHVVMQWKAIVQDSVIPTERTSISRYRSSAKEHV